MKDLSQMPNIKKKLEEKLIILGITSPDDLSWVGSKEAFFRMSLIFPQDSGIHTLYNLEGAIQNIVSNKLDTKVKSELLDFYQRL